MHHAPQWTWAPLAFLGAQVPSPCPSLQTHVSIPFISYMHRSPRPCACMHAAYYRGAMGILLVYDITNKKSFNNIRIWMKNIEEHASANVNKVGNLSTVVSHCTRRGGIPPSQLKRSKLRPAHAPHAVMRMDLLTPASRSGPDTEPASCLLSDPSREQA